MRYNAKINVYATATIETDMGGFEEQNILVGSFDAFKTPFTVTKQLQEYGLIQNKAFKLITRHTLPNSFTHLSDGQDTYNVIDYSDFGKDKVILVEVRQA